MKTILIIAGVFLICAVPGFSQNTSEKETFENAEYFFAKEDYSEALSSFLQLYKRSFHDNANINYRLGICYLHTNNEKDKAVKYLEQAVKRVSEKYNEGSIKEVNAPYDAFLFMGNAYRINSDLDKAIEAYKKYVSYAETPKGKRNDVNKNWALEQIEACKRAKVAILKPVRIKITPIGSTINTIRANYNPVISPGEDYLVYTSHTAFYEAIMVSKKINDTWKSPVNITPNIQSDGDQYPCSISQDGKTLYLCKQDNDNSDIYVSHLDGNTWSPSKPLNNEINTKYWESHACVSPDGKTLYFVSNRPQSLGGTDIFVSELDKNNDWGPAKNIGDVINTPFNEETPFICEDGKTLYFSSQGHGSIGGYDIFCSVKDDKGNWSKPVNVGYPINTTDDDLFFVPVQNGDFAYQAKYLKNVSKDLSIVKLEIFSKRHPFKYNISGNITELFKKAKPETFIVYLVKPDTMQLCDSIKPSSAGAFSFNRVAGNYQAQFISGDLNITSDKFSIPEDYQSDKFILTPDILKVGAKYDEYLALKRAPKKQPEISQNISEGKAKNQHGVLSEKPDTIRNLLFAFDDYNLSKAV